MIKTFIAGLGLLVACAPPLSANANEPLPLFDAHMHYNAEARPTISPQQVLALWHQTKIIGVLATSRPNQGTHDLIAQGAPDIRIVPFLRPYRVQPDRYDWFASAGIEAMVEEELRHGIYRGIGEFHLFGKDADAPFVQRIARLAKERGLWLHAHSDDDAIERIFRHAPGVKVIWAHTGMNTPVARVDDMLATYPTLVGELSYRAGLEKDGRLDPGWRELFLKYPNRFVIGTDTWITQRWSEVPQIAAFYRRLLAELPRETAEKIAYRNGMAMFGLK